MCPVMTKSISDAVLMSEVLGQLRHGRINTDTAASAFAWENSLSMDRAKAVKALAKDICDYMEWRDRLKGEAWQATQASGSPFTFTWSRSSSSPPHHAAGKPVGESQRADTSAQARLEPKPEGS